MISPIENLVRTGTDITSAHLVDLGAKHGLEFTADEIQEVYGDHGEGSPLSEPALEGVSGGGRQSSWAIGKSYRGSFAGRGGRIKFSWSSGKAIVMLQAGHSPEDTN